MQLGPEYELETLNCCSQLVINLHKKYSVTNIKELKGFRNKFIPAGDLNAKAQAGTGKFQTLLYTTFLMGEVTFSTLSLIITYDCLTSLQLTFWI
jgi:hypothetical protein